MAAPTTTPDPLAGAPETFRPPGDAPVDLGMTPVGGAPMPIFSAAEVEQLAYRRFNPFAYLTPERLALALDGYMAGDPRSAAILWAAMLVRDVTLATIREKRNEAVALRDWTVEIVGDDTPAAQDQAAALTAFYKRLVAANALNIHETGGFSKLASQMMDAVPFGYAVHHLIYQPDAAASFKLPSGRVVPALGARFEQVPLEFFEFRTGELRFLGLNQAYVGSPLVPGAWMITTGPCLMMAASFKHFAKRLAEQDLINFSQKFGTPGLMVYTTALQGTPEGNAAEDAARSLGADYRGVQHGATENKSEFIWPTGGTGSGNLPMTHIIEEVKRELTSLFLGADLSTMSRGGAAKGVGASLQADEQEKRERADCERISETLNTQVDPVVLRWFFGQNAPILARVVLESPINEDRALLGNLVGQLVELGAPVPVQEVARRLQVPLAKDGEDILRPTAMPAQPSPDDGIALNTAPVAAGVAARLRRATTRQYAAAKAKDLTPFTARLADIQAIRDSQPLLYRAALNKLAADMPAMLAQANADPATHQVLADGMTSELFNALLTSAAETHGVANAK